MEKKSSFSKQIASQLLGSGSTTMLAELFLTVAKIIFGTMKAKVMSAAVALMTEVMTVAVIHSSELLQITG